MANFLFFSTERDKKIHEVISAAASCSSCIRYTACLWFFHVPVPHETVCFLLGSLIRKVLQKKEKNEEKK